MKTIIICLLVSLCQVLYGQVLFTKLYQKPSTRDSPNAVIERQDGSFLILSTAAIPSLSSPSYKINIMLADSAGNLIWDKILGDTTVHLEGYSLIETQDNNYLLLGAYYSSTLMQSGSVLIKFDSLGNEIWTQYYYQPINQQVYATASLGETADSNYYFIAYEEYPHGTHVHLTDQNGNLLWRKTHFYGRAYSIVHTHDGGFVLTGYQEVSQYDQNIVLARLDQNGDSLWSKQFGGPGEDRGYSIQELPDHGYVLAAIYDTLLIDVRNYTNIIRTDSIGNLIWDKKYQLGPPKHLAICNNPNDGFVVSSRIFDYSNNPMFPHYYAMSVLKLDTLGNQEWQKYISDFYSFDNYSGNVILQTTDNAYLITGYSVPTAWGAYEAVDPMLIKLDSTGNCVLSTTPLEKMIALAQVNVFPNPASNHVNFYLQDLDGSLIEGIQIFNTLGQVVLNHQSISAKETLINTEKLETGLYFYNLKTTNNKTKTGEIIIK